MAIRSWLPCGLDGRPRMRALARNRRGAMSLRPMRSHRRSHRAAAAPLGSLRWLDRLRRRQGGELCSDRSLEEHLPGQHPAVGGSCRPRPAVHDRLLRSSSASRLWTRSRSSATEENGARAGADGFARAHACAPRRRSQRLRRRAGASDAPSVILALVYRPIAGSVERPRGNRSKCRCAGQIQSVTNDRCRAVWRGATLVARMHSCMTPSHS